MPAKSFKRNRRIADAGLFAEVLKNGKRLASGSLVFKQQPARQAGQLGLSIAKRHLKRAVDRNRVKRIVREAYRLGPESLQAIDLVVLLSRAPANIRTAKGRRELAAEVGRLLTRSIEKATRA